MIFMNTKIQAVKELTQWIDSQNVPSSEKLLMWHYVEFLSGISWYEFIFNKDKGQEGSTD